MLLVIEVIVLMFIITTTWKSGLIKMMICLCYSVTKWDARDYDEKTKILRKKNIELDSIMKKTKRGCKNVL